MTKIAFVILNYGTFEETMECVTSIRDHIDVPEYKIIIVDNASPDDSLKRLKALYDGASDVDILSNPENIGFARGNNIGIRYANEKYIPEFIAVNNSDTEIFQDDLYQKLSKEYEHSHFALLGPMMLLPDGSCNDSPWEPITLTEVERRIQIKRREKKQLDSPFYYVYKAINKVAKRLGIEKAKNRIQPIRKDFWRYQTQVELQGAFLFFSRKAFEYIEGFDERTFLYYEEQLLYLSLMAHGQVIVYDPRIAVFHKDARATKKVKGSKKEKLKFNNRCNLESLEALYQTMKAKGDL